MPKGKGYKGTKAPVKKAGTARKGAKKVMRKRGK